jgi:hypothetical protein
LKDRQAYLKMLSSEVVVLRIPSRSEVFHHPLQRPLSSHLDSEWQSMASQSTTNKKRNI